MSTCFPSRAQFLAQTESYPAYVRHEWVGILGGLVNVNWRNLLIEKDRAARLNGRSPGRHPGGHLPFWQRGSCRLTPGTRRHKEHCSDSPLPLRRGQRPTTDEDDGRLWLRSLKDVAPVVAITGVEAKRFDGQRQQHRLLLGKRHSDLPLGGAVDAGVGPALFSPVQIGLSFLETLESADPLVAFAWRVRRYARPCLFGLGRRRDKGRRRALAGC
jgi:hypothetical protein